jgi:hypothetical protein
MAAPVGFDEPRLLLSAASRALRRQLRALTWVTLEEVALRAEPCTFGCAPIGTLRMAKNHFRMYRPE